MRLLQQIGGPPSQFEEALTRLFSTIGRGVKRLFHGQCPACGRPFKKEPPPPKRWMPKEK